ncbi:M4 family metallopeptidase [Kribbella monticola]|uniref:M4 family metallopeptidase n=1 Tax=Kribbella monticola TaxID=2185285 RepID=UPI000DD47A7D|nr:M4 family metallopeptidase [Kribbella monticola]
MRRPHQRRLSMAIAAAAVAALAATTAGNALATQASSAAARPLENSAPSKQTVAASKAVIAAATNAALAHAAATGLGKYDKLTPVDALIDPDGKQHVRFTRTHKGLPVLRGDLIVHLDAKSGWIGVTRAYKKALKADTVSPKLTTGQAKKKAAAAAKGTAADVQLVLSAGESGSTLAYQVRVVDSSSKESPVREVLINALSGALISNAAVNDSFITPQVQDKLRKLGAPATPTSGIATADRSSSPLAAAATAVTYPAAAVGSGTSLFAGVVPLNTVQTAATSYLLKDSTRGNTQTRTARNTDTNDFSAGSSFTSTTNKWGLSDLTKPAVDAQYGITKTFDFYKNTFGRNGIKNDGAGAHALVHYSQNLGNAYWDPDCDCMLYGDGDGATFTKPLVVLDVTGHELSHGVVAATAALEPTRIDWQGSQFGEPGALNESLADIFGSSTEFATNNPNIPPNYLVGEQLGLAQKFLRRLDHPSLDKLEGTVDYWSKAAYDTEVHAGSGISSHAYYLLAEGSGAKTIGGVNYYSPTYDGSVVAGVGRTKATAIFYRALTRYMVSTTDFHDARVATLQAAADLYGATSTEYQTVNKAWAAVNVTTANTPAAR